MYLPKLYNSVFRVRAVLVERAKREKGKDIMGERISMNLLLS